MTDKPLSERVAEVEREGGVMRVDFDRGNGYADCTRRALIALPFGWTLEGWVRWERPRVPRIGIGWYLGEPWGPEGPLWAVALTLWAGTIGLGVRGKERTNWWDADEGSDADEDAEAPRDA